MPMRTLLAWLVHLYTALGAPLGVWAIFAAIDGDFRLAWFLIGVTVFIDSTDGVMARAVRVWEAIPYVDGRRLDDVVDYFGWVVAPVILLVQADLLPAWAAAFPLLASGYGFAQTQAKTDDDYFLGFPSYWSLIGFYLYVFQSPPAFNAALLFLLSVLVFVPIRFPYPTKTRPLRPVTLACGFTWGAMMLAILALLPDPPMWIAWSSLIFVAYYLILTAALYPYRRRQAARALSPS
ncbi:MAG: CDP-diacylglycerol O-phosphatidyltransferase [Chloroflexi bacterium]|nr:CDP-diacylglycerol O-phosphatidyltransferase [Chloroflexota bacterium]